MKKIGFLLIIGASVVAPFLVEPVRDWKDIKEIEKIQWDITVGGDGLYTSKDGKYQLLVTHPYPEKIGSEADPDGYFIFYYYGGSNFINNPPAATLQTFAKR